MAHLNFNQAAQKQPYIYRRRRRFRDYYAHPLWQAKKRKILKRDGFTCRLCGHQSPYLECHHIQYVPRRKPWEYPDEMLMTVCDQHHDFLTGRQRAGKAARRYARRRLQKKRK